MDINYNSVCTIIRRYNESGIVDIQPRSGRPKKIDARSKRLLVREVKKNRRAKVSDIRDATCTITKSKVSSKTVKRVLKNEGYKKCKARKKPFISDTNRKKRKIWAKEHRDWSMYKWKKVVWSDECNIENNNNQQAMVWRRQCEEFIPECMVGTVKSGRFSIGIWGCIGWNGIGPLRVYEGCMSSEKYIELMEDVMPEIEEKFGENIIFQDDNASCHESARTKKWKDANELNVMEWVPQSPDMNPIENLWSLLKRKLSKYKRVPSNREMLEKRIRKAWSGISTKYVRSLIKSMPRRCKAVLDSNGHPTKY